MRKFFLYLFSVILFFSCALFGVGGNLKTEYQHEFYLLDKSSSAKIITLNGNDGRKFVYLKRNLKGESVLFLDLKKVETLLKDLNAKHLFSEKGENYECNYYYSPFITNFVFIKNQKVNLHLSKKNGQLILGTPLIFGSF